MVNPALFGSAVVSLFLAAACGATSLPSLHAADSRPPAESVPVKQPLHLVPSGKVRPAAGTEISGLAKSPSGRDIYWALNDSGNPPELIPINTRGDILSNSGRGIRIPLTVNIDWESLAADDSGHLYIFDVGNNFSRRKVLQIYIVEEPGMAAATTAHPRVLQIRYPERNRPLKLIHDCEAAFAFNGALYLLSKRLHDATTVLYSLDAPNPGTINTLTPRGSFPVGGYVTGADISPDGRVLAVLTYRTLWLFYDFTNNDFFGGKNKAVPLEGGGQIESIAFTGNRSVMLINETRNEVFSIDFDLPTDGSALGRSLLPVGKQRIDDL